MNVILKSIGIALALVPSSLFSEPLLNCKSLPMPEQAKVCEVHQEYLAGDLGGMLHRMGDTLSAYSTNRVVEENLLGLLEEVYQANGSVLPSEMKLPEEIKTFKIKPRRRYREDMKTVRYSVSVVAELAAPGVIEQLQLIRLKDRQIILDKKAKLGEFEETKESDGGLYFAMWNEPAIEPPEDGVYSLLLTTRKGGEIKADLILSKATSSASPIVLSPKSGQVFSSSSPAVEIEDFTSPEFNGSERRKLMFVVVDEEKDHTLWESDQFEPKAQKAEIGPLPDGNYFLIVSFRESRRQGPIQLSRESATYVPFSVKTH